MNDLLRDPIFNWTAISGGQHAGSLPELLAFIMDEAGPEIVGFDRLQAHQQHPWHAFLVQLAAMVLHRAGASPPGSGNEEWWRAQLLKLAEDQAEAWRLAVDDLEKPAFMQPPLPDGDAALKNTALSPDAIDLYQAAKDHDCKHTRAAKAAEEQWVFALVCYQTFQGFSGRGNYGIARMNSSFGNRPGIGASARLDISSSIRRDLSRTLSHREDVLKPGWSSRGKCLLWLDRSLRNIGREFL